MSYLILAHYYYVHGNGTHMFTIQMLNLYTYKQNDR